MADPNVIRDVGNTLLVLLRSGIGSGIERVVEPGDIHLSTPDDFQNYQDPSDPVITIFLYRISINSQMRNSPRRMLPDGRTKRPLLPVDLYFMITPWAHDTSDEYRIVGRVLSTLYDNAELGSTQLRGDSWEEGDSVQIILESLPLDDHYRIWDSSSLPYRLSLTYIVRVIGIEPSEISEITPVLDAEFRGLRTE